VREQQLTVKDLDYNNLAFRLYCVGRPAVLCALVCGSYAVVLCALRYVAAMQSRLYLPSAVMAVKLTVTTAPHVQHLPQVTSLYMLEHTVNVYIRSYY
jgi:hypothetical protein